MTTTNDIFRAQDLTLAAMKTCHRTGSAFEVLSDNRRFPKKTIAFLILLANCLIWVVVWGAKQ